jgi:hypothetical protein
MNSRNHTPIWSHSGQADGAQIQPESTASNQASSAGEMFFSSLLKMSQS